MRMEYQENWKLERIDHVKIQDDLRNLDTNINKLEADIQIKEQDLEEIEEELEKKTRN